MERSRGHCAGPWAAARATCAGAVATAHNATAQSGCPKTMSKASRPARIDTLNRVMAFMARFHGLSGWRPCTVAMPGSVRWCTDRACKTHPSCRQSFLGIRHDADARHRNHRRTSEGLDGKRHGGAGAANDRADGAGAGQCNPSGTEHRDVAMLCPAHRPTAVCRYRSQLASPLMSLPDVAVLHRHAPYATPDGALSSGARDVAAIDGLWALATCKPS